MDSSGDPYRDIMRAAVSCIALDVGFDTADAPVIESLADLLQSLIMTLGTSSKSYCELAGRTDPIISDVVLAFVDIGLDTSKFSEFTARKHKVLQSPQPQSQPKAVNTLQTGSKLPFPNHIPPHFPSFPDAHTYIRTPTHKQPVIDYEAIREKFAVQKRDTEKALTKFQTRTSDTHNLFDSDELIYPLIINQPKYPTYLAGLLPQDQVFDAEDLEFKVDVMPTPPKKRAKLEKVNAPTEQMADANPNDDEEDEDAEKMGDESASQSNLDIDNPYLAATKLPNQVNAPCTPPTRLPH